MKVLIVEASFYEEISEAMAQKAIEVLKDAGVEYERLSVPGALEVPGAIAQAAKSGAYDGYVALGCVIRGETYHFEVVAQTSAQALADLATSEHLAIGNGIITVENETQAKERIIKGASAAKATLKMIEIAKRFKG